MIVVVSCVESSAANVFARDAACLFQNHLPAMRQTLTASSLSVRPISAFDRSPATHHLPTISTASQSDFRLSRDPSQQQGLCQSDIYCIRYGKKRCYSVFPNFAGCVISAILAACHKHLQRRPGESSTSETLRGSRPQGPRRNINTMAERIR